MKKAFIVAVLLTSAILALTSIDCSNEEEKNKAILNFLDDLQ